MNGTNRNRPASAMRKAVVLCTAAGFTLGGVRASAMDTAPSSAGVEVYLGMDATGLARLNQRIEASLATCMKQEGFRYSPGASNLPTDALDGGAANRKAFAEKYGYGVSTLVRAADPKRPDPNERYVGSLSAADRHSYFVALIGFDPEKKGAADGTTFTAKSCVGKATREVLGNVASVQSLTIAYEQVEQRVNADAAVVRAMRDWSSCMKRSGHTFTNDREPPTALQRRLTALTTTQTALVGAPVVTDTAGLKRLQDDERAMAKADWACSVKHLGVRDELLTSKRKEFLAQHQADLAPFKKLFGAP